MLFVFEKKVHRRICYSCSKNFCVFSAFCVRYCSPRLTQNVTRNTLNVYAPPRVSVPGNNIRVNLCYSWFVFCSHRHSLNSPYSRFLNFCVFCAFCVRYCSPRLTQNVTRNTLNVYAPPRVSVPGNNIRVNLCYSWFVFCSHRHSLNSPYSRFFLSTPKSAYLCYPWFI